MRTRITIGIAASVLAIAASVHLIAQRTSGTQSSGESARLERTAWGDPDLQGEFIDPVTWTAPWTAALDLKARPADAGVFEYACHEGNYGMSNMLSASRSLERASAQGR